MRRKTKDAAPKATDNARVKRPGRDAFTLDAVARSPDFKGQRGGSENGGIGDTDHFRRCLYAGEI
jgi:hypothetical protein